MNLQRKYMTYYGEYSLKNWIRMILTREITLPDYQRKFVWGIDMAIPLLESLINGVFVPPVILASYSGDQATPASNFVLDGQQRLSSILLCYLGYWPVEFKGAVDSLANEDTTNDIGEVIADEELNDRDLIQAQDWDFRRIQNAFQQSSDIESLKDALEQDSHYQPIVDVAESKGSRSGLKKRLSELNLDNKNFRDGFLGFSYIKSIGGDSNDEKKLFSNIFRSINISSMALTAEESRAAFYWLNPDRRQFLQPEFANDIMVNKKRLDWARCLAYVAETCETFKNRGGNLPAKLTVAKGYGTRINPFEKYIESYVRSVVDNETNDLFITFDSSYQLNLKYLEADYKAIATDKQYPSLVDADYYLFGLIFWVVFQNKRLDLSQKESLINDLDTSMMPAKDPYELKSSGKLGRIRDRLLKSVTIYQAYVK